MEITREIIGRGSIEESLPSIDKPVLVLVGSEDPLIGPGERLELLRLLADARLQILEGCGHLLHLDSPVIVAEDIVRFIGEVGDDAATLSRSGRRLDFRQHGGD